MAITVILSRSTRHVLAVLDLAGPAPVPVPLAQLVGTALPIARTGPTGAGHGPGEVHVPAGELDTAVADRMPRLLNEPMAFAVGTGRTLTPLSPWTAAASPVLLKPTGVVLTLDRTSIGGPTAVLIVLAGPAGEFTLTGTVFAGRKQTTVGVALTSGKYAVLTLAAGWHGRLEELTVP
jgi:hypothetical protein